MSFPPELIIEIARHLCSQSQLSTLSVLASTSKDTHHLVAPYLYAEVTLGSSNEPEKGIETLICRWAKEQRRFGTSDGRYVRHLTISHLPTCTNSFASTFAPHLTRVLLPNLHTVHLSGPVSSLITQWETLTALSRPTCPFAGGSVQHPLHSAVHRLTPQKLVVDCAVQGREWERCTRLWIERLAATVGGSSCRGIGVRREGRAEREVTFRIGAEGGVVPLCVPGAFTRYEFLDRTKGNEESLGEKADIQPVLGLGNPASPSSWPTTDCVRRGAGSKGSGTIIAHLTEILTHPSTAQAKGIAVVVSAQMRVELENRREEWINLVDGEIAEKIVLV